MSITQRFVIIFVFFLSNTPVNRSQLNWLPKWKGSHWSWYLSGPGPVKSKNSSRSLFISVLLLKHAYPHSATQIPHSLTTWLQIFSDGTCCRGLTLLPCVANHLPPDRQGLNILHFPESYSLGPLIPLKESGLCLFLPLSGHAFFSLFCKTWDRELVSWNEDSVV